MPDRPHTIRGSDGPAIYHIRVKGQLGPRWEEWFAPLTVTPQPDGDTLLAGPVVDQAALHGLLTKVRDLGMPLISITRVEPDDSIGSITEPR